VVSPSAVKINLISDVKLNFSIADNWFLRPIKKSVIGFPS